MVINHLEKLFVTNDAATIVRELEVSNMLITWIRKQPYTLKTQIYVSRYLFLQSVSCWFVYQVQHPAAKMILMASQQQEQEAGDGTNFVIAFAGALVENAEELLRLVSATCF